jgi:hypothetical protein
VAKAAACLSFEREKRMPANAKRIAGKWKPALFAAIVVAAIPAASWADPIDELAEALNTFRGLGIEGVESYRVSIRLPQDDSPNPVQLEEIWRRPSELIIRAKDAKSPPAVVRSVALYLEPVYVARTAVVELDWKTMGDWVRSSVVVNAGGKHGSERSILIDMPPDMSKLPATLQDVSKIEALLDGKSRLSTLDIVLREEGTIHLACEYDSKGKYNQPIVAIWTLPSGEKVEVRTKYRRESGKNVPSTRQVIFPSRFDPQETEEILVEYGKYVFNPEIPEEVWKAPGSFRYDANGLVSESSP